MAAGELLQHSAFRGGARRAVHSWRRKRPAGRDWAFWFSPNPQAQTGTLVDASGVSPTARRSSPQVSWPFRTGSEPRLWEDICQSPPCKASFLQPRLAVEGSTWTLARVGPGSPGVLAMGRQLFHTLSPGSGVSEPQELSLSVLPAPPHPLVRDRILSHSRNQSLCQGRLILSGLEEVTRGLGTGSRAPPAQLFRRMGTLAFSQAQPAPCAAGCGLDCTVYSLGCGWALGPQLPLQRRARLSTPGGAAGLRGGQGPSGHHFLAHLALSNNPALH